MTALSSCVRRESRGCDGGVGRVVGDEWGTWGFDEDGAGGGCGDASWDSRAAPFGCWGRPPRNCTWVDIPGRGVPRADAVCAQMTNPRRPTAATAVVAVDDESTNIGTRFSLDRLEGVTTITHLLFTAPPTICAKGARVPDVKGDRYEGLRSGKSSQQETDQGVNHRRHHSAGSWLRSQRDCSKS